MSLINTLVRSVGRISTPRAAAMARHQISKRSLTTNSERPSLAQGGHNRNIIIGVAAITVPALAWFAMRDDSVHATKVAAPTLDPAMKTHERHENASNLPKYNHPEDEDPELNVPFGQVHKRKRVDGVPDERNHKAMAERNRLV
ncbi:hypothetical protein F5X96DRAFT_594807 [Biscogniauxia mediterranea]|nr:hypothetical protein F5X96DRAFT_594807 [Biscogniauxia mediterranea]